MWYQHKEEKNIILQIRKEGKKEEYYVIVIKLIKKGEEENGKKMKKNKKRRGNIIFIEKNIFIKNIVLYWSEITEEIMKDIKIWLGDVYKQVTWSQ